MFLLISLIINIYFNVVSCVQLIITYFSRSNAQLLKLRCSNRLFSLWEVSPYEGFKSDKIRVGCNTVTTTLALLIITIVIIKRRIELYL